ncbi:hypothetical protein VTG60DRAFT_1682 [Thermothelomyces hinnuleus]
MFGQWVTDPIIDFAHHAHKFPGLESRGRYELQRDCAAIAAEAAEHAVQKFKPEQIMADAEARGNRARRVKTAREEAAGEPKYTVTRMDVLEVDFYRFVATAARNLVQRKKRILEQDVAERKELAERITGELSRLSEQYRASKEDVMLALEAKPSNDGGFVMVPTSESVGTEAGEGSSVEGWIHAAVDDEFCAGIEVETDDDWLVVTA